jgi:hypothetical protein
MPEQKSVLDLSDLTVSPIEVPPGENLTLEQIVAGGHLMTETGASAVGPNTFICSCCCCC